MASEFLRLREPVVGLLLAAGRGSRFGGDKLLHTLPDGTPIGVRSAMNLKVSLPVSIALVRPGDAELRRLLEGVGIECVVCERATEGMGATIACGVHVTSGTAGWVIALGDMPHINPQTIQSVGNAIAAGAEIVAPSVAGIRGHPVGFAASFRKSLLALSGDVGARSIVAANLHRLTTIGCNDQGILADIDTPADLSR